MQIKISASDFNASNDGSHMRHIMLRDAAGNPIPASSVQFSKASAQVVAAQLPPAEFGVKAMVYGAFPGSFVIGTEQQSGGLTFSSCPSDQPGTAPWPASLNEMQALVVSLD